MQINLNTASKAQTVVSKLGLTGFFLIFFLMGTVFLVLMTRDFYKSCTPYFWEETPCRIISSEITKAKNSSSDDEFKVKYNYRYKNRNYTCNKFSSKNKASKDARRWKRKYTKGLKTKCYVNSSNPHQAVIHRNIEWIMLPFLIIPLVFMAVGGGAIYFTWKKKAPVDESGVVAVKKIKPVNQRRFMLIFFAIFFIMGAGFGWMMVARPLLKIKESEKWLRKPCKIVASRVKKFRGDKKTTYSIDIAFKYKFSGVEYVGGTYDFMSGSDSDYSSKRKVVRRYSPGVVAYCYVNPEDPTEAVISREFNNPWWLAVIPLVFMLVGAGGMIGALVKRKKRKHIYSSTEPDLDFIGGEGETVLKMKSSPLKNFIGVLVFTLFWNGIVSIPVSQVIKSWETNNINWFLTLFMIPFVAVGIATIVGLVYCFIALFNSKVTISISNPRPQPGEKVTLSWKIINSASIGKLAIFLRAEESASYQTKGKDSSTHTKKSTFELLNVLDTTNKDAIHIGKTQFTIPLKTMHSFDGKNNKIIWEIVLHGDIKHRPDLKCEYPITVMPLSQESLHKILRSAETGENNG
jgi:Protein of unknown function (DUF3592)